MTISNTADRWKAVAHAVKARRKELLITQDDAIARSGGKVKGSTWSHIETAKRLSYEAPKLVAVCRALNWTDDSITAILEGGEPTVRPPDPDDVSERLTRVEQSVAEMLTLREQVAELLELLRSQERATDGTQ